VVVIATSNINNLTILLYEKTLSNIKEVKARDGIVISQTPFNKEAISFDYYIEVPQPTTYFCRSRDCSPAAFFI
jgi:glucosamine 6-phosphate synthetase-like amidotransferase/phosphosugar isomerase protein